MCRGFLIGILSIPFSLGIAYTDFNGMQKGKEIWNHHRELLAQKFGIQKHKYKGYPDYATYLEAGAAWFEPKAGANGFVLVWVEAKIPGGERDTNYQDTVDLKVAEGVTNSSVKFYLPTFPTMLPDTNNPVTSIKLDNGQAILWIRDSEPEHLILRVMPRDSLKPSHPIPYKIDTSGTTASRLVIEGPKRINAGGDMGGRYIVKVADNLGHIVTSYGDIIDPTRVSMKVIEQFQDGSAKLMDGFTGEGDSVGCGLISGKANIFLVDTSVERLTLIAKSNFGDLSPDTFEVEVLAPDQSTAILPISFSGIYGTIGVDKTILAMAFAPGIDGPDPNNNTSQVKLIPYDIMGTTSTSINPSGPQTLMGGIASFTLSDNEADSGVIVQVIPSGTPELSPWWFERVGYGFKLPGQATLIHPSGPSTSIVGDTITLYVYAVDAFDSLDPTYDGWTWIWIDGDANSSFQVLEYGTGTPQDIIRIQNGIGRVWVTNSEPEKVTAGFEDAEGQEGPFFKYLGNRTPEEGMDISFELPGDTATHWMLGLPGSQFSTDYKITGTIKACDDSNLVDTTFHDTAHILITGFAVPSDTHIVVERGIGMIEFSDDSAEKVAISVSNAGLIPFVDSVSFVAPGTAAWLVPLLPDEILVNDSLRITIYAMTSNFSIDTLWDGVAKISYSDPGASSISWVGNPDSIPINNGSGRITMLDSEVESVGVHLQYVSGEPPLVPMDSGSIQFEVRLFAKIPDSAEVGGAIDTMIFKTLDGMDSLTQYTAWVRIGCVEQIPNGSVVIDPSDSFQIINGVGIVQIENAQPETVWIHYGSANPLIQEGYFIKPIAFKEAGVEETPTQFSFSLSASNPFRKSATICYQIPTDTKVSLTIYDITGRLIRTLVDRKEKRGHYTINWDRRTDNGRGISRYTPTGIYFCKFKAGDFTSTKKLILMK